MATVEIQSATTAFPSEEKPVMEAQTEVKKPVIEEPKEDTTIDASIEEPEVQGAEPPKEVLPKEEAVEEAEKETLETADIEAEEVNTDPEAPVKGSEEVNTDPVEAPVEGSEEVKAPEEAVEVTKGEFEEKLVIKEEDAVVEIEG